MTHTEPTGERILVVGAGWDQVPLIARARERGHFVVAADGNPDAPGLALADRGAIVSTRNATAIAQLAADERVDGVTYMITESAIESVRRAAVGLGLHAPSERSVRATIDKSEMRSQFADAGIDGVRSGVARSVEQAEAVAQAVGFPLVMKAADTGGQLGLYRVESIDDVAECFLAGAPTSVSGRVVLEEWLEGDEYNVVALMIGGEMREAIISNRVKDADAAFGIVQRHLYPSDLDEPTISAVEELCERTAHAMNVRNGIIFPQVIVTPAGPRVVETGERIPGGVMKELYESVTGIDLVDLQLAISLGRGDELDLEEFRTLPSWDAVTVKFLNAYPGPLIPGDVASVGGLDRARATSGVIKADFYNDPAGPQTIRPLTVARDRFFFIVVGGADRDEVVRLSDAVSKTIDFFDQHGENLNTKRTLH